VHNMVTTVFKSLAICMVMFILAELSFQALDRITVHNRLDNLATSMLDQMRTHNMVPEQLAEMFNPEIEEIARRSPSTAKIEWNYSQNLSVPGNGEIPANNRLDTPKHYGERLYLIFKIDYKLKFFLFGSSTDPSMEELTSGTTNTMTTYRVYSTTGLRYLK